MDIDTRHQQMAQAREIREVTRERWLHRFVNPHAVTTALTAAEVVIYPGHFGGSSRKQLDVAPWDGPGSLGVVSANMPPTTGRRMGRSLALRGGLAILPQDRDFDEVLRIVREVKDADTWCERAITAKPDQKLGDVLRHLYKLSALMIVVVDEENHPIGVITHAETDKANLDSRLRKIMRRRKLVTVPHGTGMHQAYMILHEGNVEAAPVVDTEGKLIGTISKDDIVTRTFLPPSVDEQGRLIIGAAVGINGDCSSKVASLVEAECDFIVIDTAHGDQHQALARVMEAAHIIVGAGSRARLVHGNICTPEAVHRAVEMATKGGLHPSRFIHKVGVGPGSACTTRMVAGAGRAQFTAVLDCSTAARKLGSATWADGAIRAGRDVCLYTGAGAARWMLGSLTTKTVESAAHLDLKSMSKSYQGSASVAAVSDRNGGEEVHPLDRRRAEAFVEGVTGIDKPINPKTDTLNTLMTTMQSALRSGISYAGCTSAREMAEFTLFEVQGAVAMEESKPHGKVS